MVGWIKKALQIAKKTVWCILGGCRSVRWYLSLRCMILQSFSSIGSVLVLIRSEKHLLEVWCWTCFWAMNTHFHLHLTTSEGADIDYIPFHMCLHVFLSGGSYGRSIGSEKHGYNKLSSVPVLSRPEPPPIFLLPYQPTTNLNPTTEKDTIVY